MKTLKDAEKRIEKLEIQIAALQVKIEELKPRDRGPKSTRVMTDDDARRVIYGDLKDVPHKQAAAELKLSYGQIYSARGTYTFKHINDEYIEMLKDEKSKTK